MVASLASDTYTALPSTALPSTALTETLTDATGLSASAWPVPSGMGLSAWPVPSDIDAALHPNQVIPDLQAIQDHPPGAGHPDQVTPDLQVIQDLSPLPGHPAQVTLDLQITQDQPPGAAGPGVPQPTGTALQQTAAPFDLRTTAQQQEEAVRAYVPLAAVLDSSSTSFMTVSDPCSRTGSPEHDLLAQGNNALGGASSGDAGAQCFARCILVSWDMLC